jgi:hypothetical protein
MIFIGRADRLKEYTGVKIKFGVDGGAEGGDKAQIDAAVRGLVKWARENVDYLPGTVPEARPRLRPSATTQSVPVMPRRCLVVCAR